MPGQFKSKPKTVGVNTWKVSGKVLKKSLKVSGSGTSILTVQVHIPAKNPKYDTTLFIKAFNSTKDPSKNLADQIDEKVKEGENWHFSGSFTSNEYKGLDGKTKTGDDKVIWQFEPVEEDTSDEPPF